MQIFGAQNDSDLSFLQQHARLAISEFEKIFGQLSKDIKIDLNSSNCLRVGYNYTDQLIYFCSNKSVINMGLNSSDVIYHETFHAMFCQKFPHTCTTDFLDSIDHRATHEALADFFAQQISQDEEFGENFYTDKKAIRSYATKLCYALVTGSHEKGNALVSHLIEKNHSWLDKDTWFDLEKFRIRTEESSKDICFAKSSALEISIKPTNASYSSLNRYRLTPSGILFLSASMNDAVLKRFPDFSIRFEVNDTEKFIISSIDEKTFAVKPLVTEGFSTSSALFLNGNDLVGRIPFYFGIKIK
ncbi:hypothetical protein [Bdellovibrio reynosensis]|uniref:Uncharacterized protein n=1 Tax=Bdellovibrio reynosensis TaxID=2835041 RepID=A0ABY4C5R3_9BACT|nr:hypothetical protein [Bdellovibrio reynosensis]UOE99818.1 hypothetical protein MNR06_08930 [Bdellovibrio reynosensis]